MGRSVSANKRGGAPEVQRERAAATRAAIIATARTLFAQLGYHATGTNEIVSRAAMTRGALYHHFADKEELFAEVCRTVAAELVEESNSAVAGLSGKLWPQVTEAFRQYLGRVAINEEYRRILLIDGPAVLGWARWRDLQSEFVANGTAQALRMLMDEGVIERQPPEPLAFLLQAALNDAALSIANAERPDLVAEEAANAFHSLLNGLRRDGSDDAGLDSAAQPG